MPSKQYLLQLIQTLNLIVALTAGFNTINPLLSGHPNWTVVAGSFAVAVVFVIAHSLVAHIKDQSLRDAINETLDEVRQLSPFAKPSSWSATSAKTPQPINLSVPKSDTPPQG